MKQVAILVASSLLFAAPAFADTVTVQTNGNAATAIPAMPTSPPVAAAPSEQRSYDSHSVTETGDGGVQQTDKHSEQTITPEGSSTTTTKIQQQSN